PFAFQSGGILFRDGNNKGMKTFSHPECPGIFLHRFKLSPKSPCDERLGNADENSTTGDIMDRAKKFPGPAHALPKPAVGLQGDIPIGFACQRLPPSFGRKLRALFFTERFQLRTPESEALIPKKIDHITRSLEVRAPGQR